MTKRRRDGWLVGTVQVDTETGSVALIDVERSREGDTYRLTISGELFDQAPEAVTAAVQMAFLEILRERQMRRRPWIEPAGARPTHG